MLEDWSKGLIAKLPKKGNPQDCNWRSINLLSIISKICCKVILDGMQKAVDSKLSQEQVGSGKAKDALTKYLPFVTS